MESARIKAKNNTHPATITARVENDASSGVMAGKGRAGIEGTANGPGGE